MNVKHGSLGENISNLKCLDINKYFFARFDAKSTSDDKNALLSRTPWLYTLATKTLFRVLPVNAKTRQGCAKAVILKMGWMQLMARIQVHL